MKIGITGQKGFIGSYLLNTLSLLKEEFEIIDFDRSFFEDEIKLDEFVKQCDVIVHLAAINRHASQEYIHNTNLELIEILINSFKKTNSKPYVIFSSSTQETNDSAYGKSKKHGRELFKFWAEENNAKFTGLVIPNTFGPFGKPFYNSFIATFCYQLTHNENPRIDIDGEVGLVYVGDVISRILDLLRASTIQETIEITPTGTYKVSVILILLKNFKDMYFTRGEIPSLDNQFEINLFNTFRSYIDYQTHFPVEFTEHVDQRGAFVEVIRLGTGGQVSFSTTVPGITRGNHFHTRKIERFAVIKGQALIQLRKIDENNKMEFLLDGTKPAFVDMPIWYTHNIKNIGDEDLYTIFWINEFYDPNDADTYFAEV